MKFTLKKRKHSRKDYSWHKSTKLGVLNLPDVLEFLSPLGDQGQQNSCTAYAAVATRYNETNNTVFDPQAFFTNEMAFANSNGADGFDLAVPLACAVEKGFSPTNNPAAYFFITPNNGLDLFDSCRQAMATSNYPLLGGLTWYDEYTTAPGGIINSVGQNVDGGHCIKIAGWTTINNTLYMILQNSWGTSAGANGLFYMNRATFNTAFSGFGIAVWSDSQNVQIKTLGLIDALYVNVVELLQSI